MNILHISTWDIPCGIATYCANLVQALSGCGIRNDVYAIHPHRWQHLLRDDIVGLLDEIRTRAKDVDLVHIQHEHGLYGSSRGAAFAAKQFGKVLASVHSAGRPTITTFHTDIAPPVTTCSVVCAAAEKMEPAPALEKTRSTSL